MELTFRTLFLKRKYKIATQESIKVIYRKETYAAGYLMRQCLLDGMSVVVYGGDEPYYEYVHDVCPPAVRLFDEKAFTQDIPFPYIKDATALTIKHMLSLIEGSGIQFKVDAEKEPMYPDPSSEQSFYQIKRSGADDILARTFLEGILTQRIFTEPLKDMVIFMDAPLEYENDNLTELFKKASREIRIINMYYDEAEDISTTYTLYSEGRDMTCIYMGKGHRVYEQD